MFLLIVFSCGSSSHDTASDELLDLTVSLAVPESGSADKGADTEA